MRQWALWGVVVMAGCTINVEAPVKVKGEADLDVGDVDVGADIDANGTRIFSGGGTEITENSEVYISSAVIGCSASDPSDWVLHAETIGFTDGFGMVDLFESSYLDYYAPYEIYTYYGAGPIDYEGWNEIHEPPVALTDAYGDIYETVLDFTGTYANGSQTAMDCSAYNSPDYMTYAIRMWDMNGEFADCWIFGHDPEGVKNAPYPDLNAVYEPGQLANCQVIAVE